MANNIRAGRISGNPLNGLCERVCIEVKKIYDGCISRIANERFSGVPLENVFPAGFVAPLSFIRAINNGNAQIDSLVITPTESNLVRVRYNAVIPLEVSFSDVTGNTFRADATLTLRRDVVLSVPDDGSQYNVEIIVRVLGGIGTVNNLATTADFTGCVAIITRIVTMADLVIPTYGTCVYPDCRDFEDGSCNVIFSQPPFN